MFFKKKQETKQPKEQTLEEAIEETRERSDQVDKIYLDTVKKMMIEGTLIDKEKKEFTPRAKVVLQSFHNFGKDFPIEARYLAELETLLIMHDIFTEKSSVILFYHSQSMKDFVDRLKLAWDDLGLPADEIKRKLEEEHHIVTTDLRLISAIFHKDILARIGGDLHEIYNEGYQDLMDVEEFIAGWSSMVELIAYRLIIALLFLSMVSETYRQEVKRVKTLKNINITAAQAIDLLEDYLIPFYMGVTDVSKDDKTSKLVDNIIEILLSYSIQYGLIFDFPEEGKKAYRPQMLCYNTFYNKIVKIEFKPEAIPAMVEGYYKTNFIGLTQYLGDRVVDAAIETSIDVHNILADRQLMPSDLTRSELIRLSYKARLLELGQILATNEDISFVNLTTRYYMLSNEIFSQEWFKEMFSKAIFVTVGKNTIEESGTSLLLVIKAIEHFSKKDGRIFIQIVPDNAKGKLTDTEDASWVRDFILTVRSAYSNPNLLFCILSKPNGGRYFSKEFGDEDPDFADLVFDLDVCKLPKPIADHYDKETTTIDRICAFKTAFHNRDKPYYKELCYALDVEQGDINSKSKNKHLDDNYDLSLLNIPNTSIKDLVAGCKRTVKNKNFKRLTILASGESGTGKTMLASYLAKELNLELITISGSDITSKWVGESEQNVKKLFLSAGKDKLLLVEEADNLMGDREEAGTKKWDRALTNEWLVQLERFEGVLIVTTNYKDTLDKALLRRFTVKIEFKELAKDKIAKAVKTYIKKYKMQHDIDIESRVNELVGLRLGDLGNVENLILFYKINKVSKFIDYLREEIKQRKSEEKEVGFMSSK